MQPGEHRSSELNAARIGLARGVLVIVTAVAIGAFVLSQGLGDNQIEAVAAAGDGTAGDGDTSDTAEPTTASSTTLSSGTEVEQTTSTEAMAEATTSTTDTTAPAGPVVLAPGEVTVLVLNAAGTKGIAGRASEILQDAGYVVLAAKNADVLGPTEVLYLDNFEAEARAVSEIFDLDPVSVIASYDPAAPPIDDIREAIVIVIIGQDGLIDL